MRNIPTVDRRYRLAGFVLLAGLLALPLHAVDEQLVSVMDEHHINNLKPEAQKEYQLALEASNSVLYDETLLHLEKASDLDPTHIPLQFLTSRTAIILARFGQGASLADGIESVEKDSEVAASYYATAQKCMQRVKDTKNLPQDVFERATRISTQIQEEHANIELLEARRADVAYRFLVEHAGEIYRAEQPQTAAAAPRGGFGAPPAGTGAAGQPMRVTARQRSRPGEPINPFF